MERLDVQSYYTAALPGLQVRGTRGMGRCPFHDDSNPSLSIDLVRGLFICFGCGVKGSVYDFHMRLHSLGFKEALVDLASRAGVPK